MNFSKVALNVIELEAKAVANLAHTINSNFDQACQQILQCQGKLILTGIGKSGLIGKKIAATLASTGTPSIFLHPSEAIHGDFGIIQSQDIILAISHSGKTDELLKLIPAIQQRKTPLIVITSEANSPLGMAANICLSYGPIIEACSLGLAPTTSTTLTLVLGDALAVALLEGREFKAEDFANNHPGGSLGKKFIQVQHLIHAHPELPKIYAHQSLPECLQEMSNKHLGIACICNPNDELIGVITDGDVRRYLLAHTDTRPPLAAVMNASPITIHPNTLAQDALLLMEEYQITALIVVNFQNQVIGVLHIHDLVKAGFSI